MFYEMKQPSKAYKQGQKIIHQHSGVFSGTRVCMLIKQPNLGKAFQNTLIKPVLNANASIDTRRHII